MKCSNKSIKLTLFYRLLSSSSVTSRTTSAQSSCDEFLVFVKTSGALRLLPEKNVNEQDRYELLINGEIKGRNSCSFHLLLALSNLSLMY